MAVDLETLLTPVSDEAPSGPDLAYDPVRAEIEQAFDRSVSTDTSGEAGGADIDWRRTVNLIETQSRETKDIWLAVYLCRAGARTGDLALVRKGAEFLAGLCERFWDTVHPQLDEYGFQGRKGPCESLASVGDFLNPLRRLKLLQHPRLGVFTATDFERFRAGADAEDGYGMFRAALADTGEEALVATAEELAEIEAALRRVDAILVANAGDETGANFQPTYEAFKEMRRAILSFTTSTPEEEAAPAGEAEAGGGESGGGGPRIAGRVDSREDVIRAIDAIADYYRRREPASPVPLVLQRAREWVNLDFLAIMEDIAPDGIDQAKRILNFRKPDEY